MENDQELSIEEQRAMEVITVLQSCYDFIADLKLSGETRNHGAQLLKDLEALGVIITDEESIH